MTNHQNSKTDGSAMNTLDSKKMSTIELVNKNLAKRYRAETRFRAYGIASIGFGLLCLCLLFTDIIGKGHSAFMQTYVQLEVHMDADRLEITDITDVNQLARADYQGVLKQALRLEFSAVNSRGDKRKLYRLVSNGAGFELRKLLEAKPDMLGTTSTLWVLVDDDIDTYVKSRGNLSSAPSENAFTGRLSELQIGWVERLISEDRIDKKFNTNFFMVGDSREPELAGIRGAIMGSIYTMLVTLALSFPIGVAAAIYLEKYAKKNAFTEFIEVNINNLAAVPSIIYGLLGLAILISFFELPRSIPLLGGLVLTLMTLPTIIISSRAAIKAVPPSIEEAAMGIGASKMQVILHHVLPLAMPGMLTGAIIGMAQALGETAPLLMIGMVAFIVDVPGGITDPSTVLPVQIFLWSDSPERAFVEKTSAAIMVLLGFLIIMNTLAVWLRKRLERRW